MDPGFYFEDKRDAKFIEGDGTSSVISLAAACHEMALQGTVLARLNAKPS